MKQQQGFTLSELMIAMLLGLLLTGSVIGVYLSNSKTAELNVVLGELQNASRTTFELMANDIRRSGYIGCGNASRVVNVLNAANVAGSAWAVWNGGIEGFQQPAPAINGVTPLAGTDAIRLMFGSGRSYSVESHDAALNQLVLSTEHQIQNGDLLILCDETLSSIFSASGTDLTGVSHQANASNCTSGLGFPLLCDGATGTAKQYAVNAMLMNFDSISWYIAPSTDQQSTSLFRVRNNSTAEEILYGVSDLQLEFMDERSRSWRDANLVPDWMDIISVRISLQFAATGASDLQLPEQMSRMNYQVSIRNRI
ncbi:prepilin-type N-terminal cleavage/methylation domain-containing protein [Rheinheimera sp. 1928-s]|uniref:PilW family protein n=1 Tax=Rheinheimera sp. 1928-s TaxID=3033803 RepID=UPI0026062874|nr:prepilin-type N-terminal cleavage/methylation domain-containing protein [Rheinheimera sp. 1928-s]MDF3124463.1 prepilin-type N-terminal cleavage/methylation domain-containing protein [Rheinheimera sp. 1928-s]